MRLLALLFLVLLGLGCGDDDSLSNGVVPTGPPLNNVDPEVLWTDFGTRGSVDGSSKSPDGFAKCGLGDIRTDDLGTMTSTEVPDGTWNALVPDEPARCGDDFETTIWRLMNCERITLNTAPVACDQRLVWLGRQHSQDMIDRDYFDHVSPEGETPFQRMDERGIQWRGAGENIALNPTADGAHLSWMDSSGHRSNILGNYTHASCGGIENLYTTAFYR